MQQNRADLIAFGKLFLANPDLVERLRKNAPLNAPKKESFYGGASEGYTDYPTLDEAQKQSKQGARTPREFRLASATAYGQMRRQVRAVSDRSEQI